MADTLPVSGASFTEIKQNLIEFLNNQEEFKDYDLFGECV